MFGVHGAMACGGASEGHAVKNALSRRHNHLAKQLCFELGTGGVPAMLEHARLGRLKDATGRCDVRQRATGVARASHDL